MPPLAERLLASCPALTAHLQVEHGAVRLADSRAFADCFDAVAGIGHDMRRQAAEAAARTANVRDSAAWRQVERKAARHAQLWVPWRRRMVLSGLRLDSAPCASRDNAGGQHVVSDPDGMKSIVAEYWGGDLREDAEPRAAAGAGLVPGPTCAAATCG